MSSPGPACPVTNTLLEITRGERGVGVATKLLSSQANTLIICDPDGHNKNNVRNYFVIDEITSVQCRTYLTMTNAIVLLRINWKGAVHYSE